MADVEKSDNQPALARFSPGPWRAIEHTASIAIRDADNQAIANLPHRTGSHYPTIRQANANLIVSAPDLYRALVSLVALYDGGAWSSTGTKEARIVLAKALREV